MKEKYPFLSDDIIQKSISLESIGLYELAWKRDMVLVVLEMARLASIPLLGGDIYSKQGSRITPAYLNWSCEPKDGEDEVVFLERSISEGIHYISSYNVNHGESLYAPVFDYL